MHEHQMHHVWVASWWHEDRRMRTRIWMSLSEEEGALTIPSAGGNRQLSVSRRRFVSYPLDDSFLTAPLRVGRCRLSANGNGNTGEFDSVLFGPRGQAQSSQRDESRRRRERNGRGVASRCENIHMQFRNPRIVDFSAPSKTGSAGFASLQLISVAWNLWP